MSDLGEAGRAASSPPDGAGRRQATDARPDIGLRAKLDAITTELQALRRLVETGKGWDALDRRPQLAAALRHARKVKAHIVVAKLDRLSRDVAFNTTASAPASRMVATTLRTDFALRSACSVQPATSIASGKRGWPSGTLTSAKAAGSSRWRGRWSASWASAGS